jgi:hypothetical protein
LGAEPWTGWVCFQVEGSASLIGMLIQKPHNIRLARIESEAITQSRASSCETLLDLHAPEFWGNARLGPPAQSAALFRIAVACSIDRHLLVPAIEH